jgi:hypothetical protein
MKIAPNYCYHVSRRRVQTRNSFQWAGYDRHPELQTHMLLGVGEPAVALQAAIGGLLTKTVRAAAKSGWAAGLQPASSLQRERGPRHGNETRKRKEDNETGGVGRSRAAATRRKPKQATRGALVVTSRLWEETERGL